MYLNIATRLSELKKLYVLNFLMTKEYRVKGEVMTNKQWEVKTKLSTMNWLQVVNELMNH